MSVEKSWLLRKTPILAHLLLFPPEKHTPDEHLFPNMECRLWVGSSYCPLSVLKFRFPESGYWWRFVVVEIR
jgi:hypothetical protein